MAKDYRKYPNLTKAEIQERLQGLFDSDDFNNHIKQTADEVGVDQQVVKRVMTNYILNIHYKINRWHSKDFKINLTGFLQLIVKKSRFKKEEK